MRHFVRLLLIAVLIALAADRPGLLNAQDIASSEEAKKPEASKVEQPAQARRPRKAASEAPLPITPEREAAALDFVRIHHPELVNLLEQLKSKDRRQYEVVVRDLFRTSERLAAMQQNDLPRYEIALQAWKLKSRIQVLAARASLDEDPAILADLRAALEEQSEVRKQQLKYERDLLAERLHRAESALANFERDRSQQVDRQYEMLLKQIEKSRKDMTLRLGPRSDKARPPKRADKSPAKKAGQKTVDAAKE
jgi:hypothetical protein